MCLQVTPGNPDDEASASDDGGSALKGRRKGKRKGKRLQKKAAPEESSAPPPPAVSGDSVPYVPCTPDSLTPPDLREHGQALTCEMFEGTSKLLPASSFVCDALTCHLYDLQPRCAVKQRFLEYFEAQAKAGRPFKALERKTYPKLPSKLMLGDYKYQFVDPAAAAAAASTDRKPGRTRTSVWDGKRVAAAERFDRSTAKLLCYDLDLDATDPTSASIRKQLDDLFEAVYGRPDESPAAPPTVNFAAASASSAPSSAAFASASSSESATILVSHRRPSPGMCADGV
jgi:hypothetical protein